MKTVGDKAKEKWQNFFYDAKNNKQMMRVVDRWNVIYEGRIYRNGTDRVNIIPLVNNGGHTEIYYANIVDASIIGPEPEGLKDFFGDWNKNNS